MGLIRKFTATNPHLKIALVVAPLLMVGGYIIADLFELSTTPESTESANNAKPLVVDDRCRLLGEVCELLHREIAVNIGAEPGPGSTTLVYLSTSVPVDGVLVAREKAPPIRMTTRGSSKRWKAELPYPLAEGERIRLALVRGEHRYFAEITTRKP